MDAHDNDAATLARIFELEREVTRCEIDHDAKKLAASDAKKVLGEAQERLNDFIRKNDYPLFDGVGEPDFSKPGPRRVGYFDDHGNLHCAACGSSDLGPVDGDDPMCNSCNCVVLSAGTFTTVGKRRAAGESA